MEGVFTAAAAELFQFEFSFNIDFVLLGDIVLGFADGTDQS
ncbi:MAG: hypothetical protein UX91_C0003G0046 [Candidatus Amesbacteria bacterium GW2011_GWB1_47_19]|nr:MAG: hypothetical protein UW51_C0003G0052 [Candidatus Amesbacteria bacterium GW2011_GWA1_44_24]KKU31477.1 MAG: hypothetical protein UX46_C0005G0046 [Candidatus Amesbacteria bacterium GW2011_GWC1_46_24]KKU67485.1 MAG: hypothetical protein UX91_C0003G0046 [Candidatus Amesbacteria bacterium GW2011_GWB1_47_19]